MNHAPKTIAKGKRDTAWAIPWPVCSRCGLVFMKNQAPKQAVREACPGKEDPPETYALK